MTDLAAPAIERLQRHPGFARVPKVGERGYEPPRLGDPLVLPVEEATRGRLLERGLTVNGSAGVGCVVIVDARLTGLELGIGFRGHDDCTVIIGMGGPLAGEVNFWGPGGLAGFGGCGTMHGSRIALTINAGCAAYFAPGFTSVGSQWLVEEDASGPCCVMAGDDSMVSWDVWCRNSDSHGIFDIASLALINPARDLVLGAHVWLGQGVRISRGVTIGAGSIIGLGAVVAQDIPARVAAVGTPARVVREGVTWSRGRQPTEAQMRAMVERL
jgi:hypothetical protein